MGKRKDRLFWHDANVKEARREGWAITYLLIGRDDGIVSYPSISRAKSHSNINFRTDEEARKYVDLRADQGSPLHCKALAIIAMATIMRQ